MRTLKPLALFCVGGFLYVITEMLFRGRSHWTMFIVGGLCFWLVGLINEIVPWDMLFQNQCLIGGAIITSVEFASGCIINLFLGWDVWDYSGIPFNILGQICLPFSIAWCFLTAAAIILDDYLRYWLFGEEKPHYIFKK